MLCPYIDAYTGKRYHTFHTQMMKDFGCRVVKLALNGGFTCPNLDGTKGFGGCVYCSEAGSGDFAGKSTDSLEDQYAYEKRLLAGKWKQAKYLAYFQAHSNTYAPVSRLKELFEQALSLPEVVGLSVSTRPDLLPEDVLQYLSELNRRTYLEVELGLQSIHNNTLQTINRCHTYEDFLDGYRALEQRGIRVCVHIINGLPGETLEMMLQTAESVGKLHPSSVKIHALHILKNTRIFRWYETEGVPLLSKKEYVSLVCDQLERFPAETVIQRLTGDGRRSDLVAPLWTLGKRGVLNDIDRELKRRDSWQGKYFSERSSCVEKNRFL